MRLWASRVYFLRTASQLPTHPERRTCDASVARPRALPQPHSRVPRRAHVPSCPTAGRRGWNSDARTSDQSRLTKSCATDSQVIHGHFSVFNLTVHVGIAVYSDLLLVRTRAHQSLANGDAQWVFKFAISQERHSGTDCHLSGSPLAIEWYANRVNLRYFGAV